MDKPRTMAQRGCCTRLHLREDNARFILLAFVMVIYMLFGASLFMLLEHDLEANKRQEWSKTYQNFLDRYGDKINTTDLEELLSKHEEATSFGYVQNKRERWDFAGSFYFVGTVVSTIGFGMTTPRTMAGKIILIFYGFLGCAGAILFFNLFLERIITFLAYVLRRIHEHDLRRKGLLTKDKNGRRGSQGSEDNLDSWKPSVYWVMLILMLGAIVIACCASALYHPVEQWTYFEAIYFCFVTFATIGFGDLVVSQSADYQNINVHIYRFMNFILIVLGCCCIYSLFNVISIVIKQVLNWLIRKLDCKTCQPRPKPRPRRNAITPGHLQRATKKSDSTDVDSNYDSDYSRRGSGEMISMKDFLQNNKISLLMMQKQLHDTSRQAIFQNGSSSGFQGGVGPLAILNKKLGQEDV
ncbi:potassium channel subfamily K member 13 [Lingula anatina]|uniref:Potassium channel subfamily K member 13 n=1 Tax=Lingula anatina TaxID=7574 RepID=A0A1S3K542_LINAN|nr:potassium channel subfamily K member 13 [Lingula anatina]|eukprot:XP_013417539.1 potassium channel subfamily K member 13 [Lingula anatina]